MQAGEDDVIRQSELASGWEYSEPSPEEEPTTAIHMAERLMVLLAETTMVIPMPDIMGIIMVPIKEEPTIPLPNTILPPPTMLPLHLVSTIGAITGTKGGKTIKAGTESEPVMPTAKASRCQLD